MPMKLEAMAVELEVAGAPEVAERLRRYRDVQRDEGQIVVDELVDIQSEAVAAQDVPPPIADTHKLHDPAVNSPKRARWLAEQAAEAERLKQPISRRDLFGRGALKTED